VFGKSSIKSKFFLIEKVNYRGSKLFEMGGTYRKSRTHKAKKAFKRKFRTCCREKDIDQIQEELEKKSLGIIPFKAQLHEENYSDAEDLPGGGKFSCEPCDKFFIDQITLDIHLKTKNHKKRIKLLQETPYTHKEADAAGGVGTNDYHRKASVKMQIS
jgi:bud site selection protein 20